MERKELRLGDPTFREIRERNIVYADKTEYIHKMINLSKCCFLSRPRRFGKTLLIKTIDELFRGNRELFDGLWIGTKNRYAFDRHPVLRFNLSFAEIKTAQDLVDRIKRELVKAANREGVTLSVNSYDEMLYDLLYGLYRKHGVDTVVLIDEYDAPVARHISDKKLASDNREVLHDFFGAIKTNGEYIHFALVTGITRFAMTAMDSGPNNFKDISLMPEFSGICGFTVEDLDSLFEDRFDDTLTNLKENGQIGQDADHDALKLKILEWYDGYNWLGTKRVLNPFSILNFFSDKVFDEYWPSSGIPTHLSALVREKPLEFIQPKLDSYTTKQLRKVELHSLTPIPIMFHSGYLTIDGKTRKEVKKDGRTFTVDAFTFRTPNLEVDLNYRASFFTDAFGLDEGYFNDFSENFPKALLNRDSEEVVRLTHGLLAAVTYWHHLPSERYNHSVLHASFLAAGIEVLSEVSGGHGRSDIVVFLDGRVRVVIELKYRQARGKADGADNAGNDLSSALDDAEKSMREGDYLAAHRMTATEMIPVALAIRDRDEVAARFLD
ncbi:MAG: AAA family ATPase [Deltaproteobacteria bacterium]|jgi:hypothetical protein|nr:AAA family ATPase [Deltaproteobacteria bacterium]